MNSAPNCVNTTNNSDNCGGCASIDEHFVCKSNYYCSDSSCVQSKCDGNQCRLNDTCVNTVVTCGTRCTDCTSLQGVSKASCDAGYCKASLCLSNYHLKIESAETVCEENTIELCGKPDSNVIYNCYSVLNAKDPENVGNYDIFCDLGECKFECKPGFTRTKDDLCVANNEHNCNGVDCYNQYQTAATVKCDEGVCKVMTCHDEYHLIKKNGELECEANTIKKCGKGDSQTTRDCTKAFSDANDVSCNHGVCEIVSCKSGYHLSGEPGDYQCVKNSSTSCGKPDSAVTYDCNTIPMASGNCTSSGVCECSYNGNTNSYTILEFGQDGESLYCRTHVTCGGVVCENQEGWHFGWCENFGSYYHPDYRCYSKTCQKGYHKKKIVIGNDWTADCEINTNEACGIVTTGGDQIDKYPISCSSMSATCNNDYGLCYRESDHKYYCQSGETSGFNWRNLSDCYYK